MRLSLLIVLTLTSLIANADELNLGYPSGGQSAARLSVRTESDSKAFRYAPAPGEVGCPKYRKDFCGVEKRVSFIDVSTPNPICKVTGDDEYCRFSTYDSSSIAVEFIDGSRKIIENVTAFLELTKAADGSYAVKFFLQGNRVDGFDVIIRPSPDAEVNQLKPVTNSLF